MKITMLTNRNCKSNYLYLACRPKEGRGRLIFMQEGTGENLDADDRREGYVDYINWYDVSLGECEVIEDDGGMVMFKTYVAYSERGLLDYIETIAKDAGIPDSWEVMVM